MEQQAAAAAVGAKRKRETVKQEAAKKAREQKEELVQELAEVYIKRIESIIQADNVNAFVIVLRNRNGAEVKEKSVTDSELVHMLIRYNAVKCMAKLQPFGKYNQVDHLQNVPIEVLMDPKRRQIVVDFLFKSESYEDWHGRSVKANPRLRALSLSNLLDRAGSTAIQRRSFLRAVLKLCPFSRVTPPRCECLHLCMCIPPKSDYDNFRTWLWRFSIVDTACKLTMYTVVETEEDNDVLEDAKECFDEDDHINYKKTPYAQMVLQDRATKLYKKVDKTMKREADAWPAALSAIVCGYLNSQIDPKLHKEGCKLPPSHIRLLRAADQQAAPTAAGALVPAAPMELED